MKKMILMIQIFLNIFFFFTNLRQLTRLLNMFLKTFLKN